MGFELRRQLTSFAAVYFKSHAGLFRHASLSLGKTHEHDGI
jgi:hypothetical protein